MTLFGKDHRKPNPPRRGSALWIALKRNLPSYVGRRRRPMRRLPLKPQCFIDPETNGKRIWDLMLTCLVLYTTCFVPYRVCFQVEASGGFTYLENSMDIMFFIDIILNFITGIQVASGEMTYNFRKIARAYLRGWFMVDFFSTLPFDSIAKLFGVGSNAHAALLSTKLLRGLKVLRLFKLARIRRLTKVFTNLEDAVYTNQSLVSLVKLALTILFIAHLVACLWYAVGKSDSTESWLITLDHDPAGLVDDSNGIQYIRSLYWAIVTMTTIGYGDIVAHSNNERIVNIVVMAVGVSFFGYVIGTISGLVTNLDVAAARYDERMTVVKEYIISRRMPKHLSNKVRGHFEYYYQNRSVFKEGRILHRLPSALRNEMIHHVHSKYVSSIKYFDKCPESLVSDMVMAMNPFSMMKDEYVFVEHEIAAHVYFVIKGKLQLVKTARRGKEDMRLASMGVGDHFGELEVYDHDHGNGVRICSAVAKSYSELTFLSREAIQKISVSWPEALKHFRETAAVCSKSMRRRVDTSALRHDVLPEHDILDLPQTMMKSAAAHSKVIPARPARVAPFVPTELIDTSVPIEEVGDSDGHHTSGEVLATPPRQAAPIGESSRERTNQAWLASTDPGEASSIQSTHILTRPLASTQGRKATLEALPDSPSARAKFGAKIATFHSFDGLESKETNSDGFEKKPQQVKESPPMVATIPKDTSEGTTKKAPEHRYTPAQLGTSPAIPETAAEHDQETLDHQEIMDKLAKQDPLRGKPFFAATTDENELHDMIVKIRDSPHEHPKRNFKSERVMLRGTYLFHPQEPMIVFWQLFVGVGIIYSIIVVPFRLGFDADATGKWYVLEMIIDSFFLVDIVLNFRTAYFDDERRLIYDSRVLFWRYMKGWFLLDLLSTLPIDEIFRAMVGSSNQTLKLFPTKLLRLFRIARLLKLTRLIKLSRVFGRIRDIVQLSPSTERLFKLLAIMSMFCHWNACVFHGVMLVSESLGLQSWCDDAFFPGQPQNVNCADLVAVGDRYVAAIYWAFTTLTTVGYGDIKPSLHSSYELTVVITLIVVNATVFGYVIASVMTLIQNLDPSDREYRALMTEMKDYLRDSSVSVRMCTNVKMHYEHHIACTSLFPERKLFDKMAPSLRFDVARLVAVENLFAIPLITVMEDAFKGFVSYALFLMQPVCIRRGETVCRCGSPGVETFFLVEGECDLMNSQSGTGRIIGENAVFEQYALMVQPGEIYRSVSTATALTPKVILYSLSFHDFKTMETVSPAVSTYFLSQLASVLVADGIYSLQPHQKDNVHHALRQGQHFRVMAENTHGRIKLKDLSRVAMANLNKRRSSEWSPDLLPKQLQMLSEKEEASGVTLASANVNAIANAFMKHDFGKEHAADTTTSSATVSETNTLCANGSISEDAAERTNSRNNHMVL